jgi:hypothetical protein
MVRAFVEERLGRPWIPGEEDLISDGSVARGVSKRRNSRS